MRLNISSKLLALIFLIFFIVATISSIVIFQASKENLIQAKLASLSKNMEQQSNVLLSTIRTLDYDIGFISKVPPIQGIIRTTNNNVDPVDGTSTQKDWHNRLNHIFKDFMQSKPYYHSIYYLDNNGNEMVRVDWENNKLAIKTGDEFQNKSSEISYTESIKLQDGEIYLSDINLNQEHGKIASPYTPVIHAATPIYDNNANVFGTIIVSANLTKIMDDIKNSTPRYSKLYLINDKGEFLIHPQSDKEFSFNFGSQHNIQSEYPLIKKMFSKNEMYLNNKQGVLSHETNTEYLYLHNIAFDKRMSDRFFCLVISTPKHSTIFDSIKKHEKTVLVLVFSVVAILLSIMYLSFLIIGAKSIKRKVAFGYLLMATVLTISVLVTIWQGSKITEITNRLKYNRAPTTLASTEMLNGINHALAALRGWLILGEEKFKNELHYSWEKEITPSLRQLNKLSINWSNSKNLEQLDNITIKLRNFKSHQQLVEHNVHIKNFDEAKKVLGAKAAPTAFEVKDLLNEMISNQKHLMEADFSYAEEQDRLLSVIEWVLLLVGLLVSAALGYLITRSITIPISKALHAADQVAAGNYDINLDISENEEIKKLGNSLQDMANSLKETTKIAEEIAAGRLDIKLTVKNDKDLLSKAVNKMVADIKLAKDKQEKQLNQLSLSEARSQGIVNLMVDGLITINPKGIVQSFNPASEKIFGYRAEEVIGNNIDMLMPEPYQSEHDVYLKNYKYTGKKKIIGIGREVEGKRKDGSKVPIELAVSSINVEGEKLYVGTLRDISERKEAEKNSLISQKELEAEKSKLIEQDWVKSIYADISGKLQGIKSVEDFASTLLNNLIPAIGAQVGAFYLKDKINTTHNNMSIDNNLRKESVSRIASYALDNNESTPVHYKSGENIVGQVLAEKKPLTIEQAPAGYMTVKSTTGSAEPANISVLPIMFENELVAIMEIASLHKFSSIQHELLTQVIQNIGISLSTILSRIRTEILLEQTQSQAEELKIREDELKRSNEDLIRNTALAEKANKTKSEFLANMSHELRTPLNSLLILAQDLANNDEGNLQDDQLESARIIYNSGSDLLSLINDILDLSKVEAGKMEFQAEDFALDILVDGMKQKFDHIAAEQDLIFNINIDSAIPSTIYSDKIRIEQILRNFLSNAFKFTHKGSITINIHRPKQSIIFQNNQLQYDKTIAFSVVDTGIGIAEDKIDYIFQAFQQEDGSTSRQYGGTGLGLSISREFAKLLGGEIQLDSTQGQGSIFTLYIPQDSCFSNEGVIEKTEENITSAHNLIPEIIPPNTTANPRKLRSKKNNTNSDSLILIIEDDINFVNILKKEIVSKGLEFLIATNGKQGIKLATKHLPSAIILDIALPDISGLDVFDQIIENEITSNIPVYFMSVTDESKEALAKGAIGYLTKPVTKQQLNSAIAKIETISEQGITKILVIEDNATISALITEMLTQRNFQVIVSDSAEDGLQKLKSNTIHCIILDLMLPGMSGIDFLKKIECDPNLIQPPAIIYSGKDISKKERKEIEKYTTSLISKIGGDPEQILAQVLGNIKATPPLSNENVITPTATPSDAVQKPITIGTKFRGKNILIVDDDTRNIFALSRILSKAGMNVDMVQNGQQALDYISKKGKTLDIVLMDIMMPIMDGYEAIANIRKNKEYSDLPIIAVTAKAMKEDKEKCINIGASDYFTKPIDANKLFVIMSKWLEV